MKTYLNKCIECSSSIDKDDLEYSLYRYNHAVCGKCHKKLEKILKTTSATEESINLYLALKRREVPAEIEMNDGYKTIDISVPDAKVNIEVDGGHHFNAKQALADLKRTYYSFINDGFLTLRIPNSLVQNNLDETADYITDFLIKNKERTTTSNNTNSEYHLGYCIRCSMKIDLNPSKPLCSSCYNEWSYYENYSYQENNCHCCGTQSNTTMSKPLCYSCYKSVEL